MDNRLADDVRNISDARSLAALVHPDRARLIDALAVNGPSSTTDLAHTLGVATGSVSHHVRVLAAAGLVETAGEDSGDRRRRRWKLVSRGMRWSPSELHNAAAESAGLAAEGVLLSRQYDRAREFLDTATPPWNDGAYSGHFWMKLTVEELTELGAQIDTLLLEWRRRRVRDDGAERRTVLAFAHAFPAEP